MENARETVTLRGADGLLHTWVLVAAGAIFPLGWCAWEAITLAGVAAAPDLWGGDQTFDARSHMMVS